MSNAPVEMKVVFAHELRPNNVFEMFGNLYQVFGIIGHGQTVEVVANIIAQVGVKSLRNGNVFIKLSKDTPVAIEA